MGDAGSKGFERDGDVTSRERSTGLERQAELSQLQQRCIPKPLRSGYEGYRPVDSGDALPVPGPLPDLHSAARAMVASQALSALQALPGLQRNDSMRMTGAQMQAMTLSGPRSQSMSVPRGDSMHIKPGPVAVAATPVPQHTPTTGPMPWHRSASVSLSSNAPVVAAAAAGPQQPPTTGAMPWHSGASVSLFSQAPMAQAATTGPQQPPTTGAMPWHRGASVSLSSQAPPGGNLSKNTAASVSQFVLASVPSQQQPPTITAHSQSTASVSVSLQPAVAIYNAGAGSVVVSSNAPVSSAAPSSVPAVNADASLQSQQAWTLERSASAQPSQPTASAAAPGDEGGRLNTWLRSTPLASSRATPRQAALGGSFAVPVASSVSRVQSYQQPQQHQQQEQQWQQQQEQHEQKRQHFTDQLHMQLQQHQELQVQHDQKMLQQQHTLQEFVSSNGSSSRYCRGSSVNMRTKSVPQPAPSLSWAAPAPSVMQEQPHSQSWVPPSSPVRAAPRSLQGPVPGSLRAPIAGSLQVPMPGSSRGTMPASLQAPMPGSLQAQSATVISKEVYYDVEQATAQQKATTQSWATVVPISMAGPAPLRSSNGWQRDGVTTSQQPANRLGERADMAQQFTTVPALSGGNSLQVPMGRAEGPLIGAMRGDLGSVQAQIGSMRADLGSMQAPVARDVAIWQERDSGSMHAPRGSYGSQTSPGAPQSNYNPERSQTTNGEVPTARKLDVFARLQESQKQLLILRDAQKTALEKCAAQCNTLMVAAESAATTTTGTVL